MMAWHQKENTTLHQLHAPTSKLQSTIFLFIN
uniref:Uncharacterized protein n=1 Tax=Arundo donax TaxID=35708 RepID=A0A0A9G1Y6_ARUDO